MSARTADLRAVGDPRTTPAPGALRRLVTDARLEVIPMASLPRAVGELRPGTRVSVTCSPTRTVEATLEATADLVAAGHDVTPHVAARMVRDTTHLRDLVDQLAATGTRRMFLVGGDAPEAGAFPDAVQLLPELLSLDPPVDHIGLPGYPDGHPHIDPRVARSALHRKVDLVRDSGRTTHVSTQMCFSADTVRQWVRHERESGLRVPIHLGLAGPIDRTKLLAVGVRLGVGPSMRYLSKNRTALARLVGSRSYRPDHLVRSLAASPGTEIDGLHVFTFNAVAAAEAWRDRHRRA